VSRNKDVEDDDEEEEEDALLVPRVEANRNGSLREAEL
jgi:hypothetical protein